MDATRQSIRRIMLGLSEFLDDEIAQAKRNLLDIAEEPGGLTPESKGAVVRLFTLLARAGQVRQDEKSAFIPRDMVRALTDLYSADPGIDPEIAADRIEKAAVEALTRLGLIEGRIDLLATTEAKRRALLAWADDLYTWRGHHERDWRTLAVRYPPIADQESLYYGNIHPRSLDEVDENDLVMPKYMVGSDYSGDTAERSNYRAFLEDYEEVEGVFPVYGGHGTYGVAIQIVVENDEMWERLTALKDYPLYDEEAHSEVEMEAEQEAWENWAASDFRSGLEQKFEDYEFDEVSDDDLIEFFDQMRERANVYWEPETGGSMYIRMERVLEVIETRDIIELEGVTFPEDEEAVVA